MGRQWKGPWDRGSPAFFSCSSYLIIWHSCPLLGQFLLARWSLPSHSPIEEHAQTTATVFFKQNCDEVIVYPHIAPHHLSHFLLGRMQNVVNTRKPSHTIHLKGMDLLFHLCIECPCFTAMNRYRLMLPVLSTDDGLQLIIWALHNHKRTYPVCSCRFPLPPCSVSSLMFIQKEKNSMNSLK